MKRGKIAWKRVLIVLVGALALCLLSCVALFTVGRPVSKAIFARMWNTDPTFAAQAAHQLLDYDLPPGYYEQRALVLQGDVQQVVLAHRERPQDMIALEPDALKINDPANLEYRGDIENMWARDVGGERYDTRLVMTQTLMIRGAPVTFSLREGQDESARPVRMMVGLVTGKQGDVVINIVSGLETWDQAMADQFLQSIR
jgi:hypothetical protein